MTYRSKLQVGNSGEFVWKDSGRGMLRVIDGEQIVVELNRSTGQFNFFRLEKSIGGDVGNNDINMVGITSDDMGDFSPSKKSKYKDLLNTYYQKYGDEIKRDQAITKISAAFEEMRKTCKRPSPDGQVVILDELVSYGILDYDVMSSYPEWRVFADTLFNKNGKVLYDRYMLYVYDDIIPLSGTAGFYIQDFQEKERQYFVIMRS